MSHSRYYSVDIIDATDAHVFRSGLHLRHQDQSATPERPPLEHVLAVIDSFAASIAEEERRLRQNNRAAVLCLTARLPIEPGFHDTPKHKYFGDWEKIAVCGGIEIEKLKSLVSASYEATRWFPVSLN